MHEPWLLFAQLKKLNRLISGIEITEIIQNLALADMAPNLICALETYIVLLSSPCEVERSFSTLRRLLTYLCSTQTQQCLNDLVILNTHRDDACKCKATFHCLSYTISFTVQVLYKHATSSNAKRYYVMSCDMVSCRK